MLHCFGWPGLEIRINAKAFTMVPDFYMRSGDYGCSFLSNFHKTLLIIFAAAEEFLSESHMKFASLKQNQKLSPSMSASLH